MDDVVAWTDIAGEVKGEMRQVPSPAIRAACHRNAIRCLNETRIWRVVPRAIALTPGQPIYPFNLPEHTDVVEVPSMQLLSAVQGGGAPIVRSLMPVARAEALEGAHGVPAGWPDSGPEARAAPRVYMEWALADGSRCFALAPTPDDERRRRVRPTVVLTVGARARGLPPALYTRLRVLVREAVLWDIYSQRDQPWGSAARAEYHQREYVAKRNRLRADPGLASKRERFVRGGTW